MTESARRSAIFLRALESLLGLLDELALDALEFSGDVLEAFLGFSELSVLCFEPRKSFEHFDHIGAVLAAQVSEQREALLHCFEALRIHVHGTDITVELQAGFFGLGDGAL